MTGWTASKKVVIAPLTMAMLFIAFTFNSSAATARKFNNATLKNFRCIFSLTGETYIQQNTPLQPFSMAGVLRFDGIGTVTLEYLMNVNGISELKVPPLPTVGYTVNSDGTGFMESVQGSPDPQQVTFSFFINNSVSALTLSNESMFANQIGATLYTGGFSAAGTCIK